MPLITEAFDSLPYLDSEPTPEAYAAAQALIIASLSSDAKSTSSSSSQTLHSLLPPSPELHFSPLIEQELARVAAKQPLRAIDTSRYEGLAQPPPPPANPTSSLSEEDKQARAAAWRTALTQAYTAHAHVTARSDHLTLLEQHGRNAWLLGNYALEGELGALERELAEAKRRGEGVNRERRAAQEGARAEMELLERQWREGVGRVLEVVAAAEGVRREILEALRVGGRKG